MNNIEWGYFILGIVAYQILKLLYLATERLIIERRQKKFLKMVSIKSPRSKVSFIAIDSSDKRAMARLERQVRDEYDIPEEPDQDGFRDRHGPGDLRFTHPRDREDPSG